MDEPSHTATNPSSPPKVRLTFRVGIVGHRPNRLKREDIPSLTARLVHVLSVVKTTVYHFADRHPGLFTGEPPVVRAISPLAEGTDRYFAREALKQGYELCCPLPFHKEEFENDFKPGKSLEHGDSVADFHYILQEAKNKTGLVLFELDGARDQSSAAYAAAGRVVLNQSDLLVVVWDGGDENKRGGTYETLVEAIKFAIPVLWIDAHSPHTWQLLRTEKDLPPPSSGRSIPRESGQPDAPLQDVIRQILAPPKKPTGNAQHYPEHKHDLRKAFFAESKPCCNIFPFWKLFRDFVGSFRIRLQSLRIADFEQAVLSDWPPDDPNHVERWINNQLRPHYAWADKLADFYADHYRSSFIICYLFGALAVVAALLTHFLRVLSPAWSTSCSWIEIVLVAVICGLVLHGNWHHWHQRWMNYRLLAELIRQFRFLVPFGGARPFPRLPLHLNIGNPANTWMYWHVRSIDRAVGLPNVKITPNYLKKCAAYVARIVQGQIDFHRATAERTKQIEHRLHWFCLMLFVATAFMAVVHLITHYMGPTANTGASDWDTPVFLAAVLPAFGAAVAAISNQGEFSRITRRSRAMAEQLEHDLQDLKDCETLLRSHLVAAYALRAAQTMVDEVLDWHLVFLDRPLVTPA